jgi:hypothetical protein
MKFCTFVNEGIAIVFIFYGLYLVKNENTIYQLRILDKNRIPATKECADTVAIGQNKKRCQPA